MRYPMAWIVEELEKAESSFKKMIEKANAENDQRPDTVKIQSVEYLTKCGLGKMTDGMKAVMARGRMDTLKDVLLMHDKYSLIKRRDFNRNVERIQKAQRRKRKAVDPYKFLVDMKLFFFDVGVTRMKRIKEKMEGKLNKKDNI